MASLTLPEGYRSRPARLDDAEGVARVIAACEVAHDHGTHTTADDIRDEWQDTDLDDETVVVEDASGEIVATADILNRNFSVLTLYGYVHPEHEGEGLGRFLIGWGEQWATDHMEQADPDHQVVVRNYIQSKNPAAIELLETSGYEAVRNTYVMAIDLNESPPEPVWPEGVEPKPYRPGVDEREVFEAVEDAFRDTWGRPPSNFERFLKFARGSGVKPDLWVLAWGGNEIAGVCLGTLTDDQGWIPTVGVRRAWRRKGLGIALLHAGFGAYYRRGVKDVRLSVDGKSLTGANRLYERAGMHVASNYIVFEKVLREGIDTGVDSESA